MRQILFTLILILIPCVSAAASEPPRVQVVPKVDLSRYAGDWYELARLPMYFQEGCVDSRTSYRLVGSGDLAVVNRCRNVKDGGNREARGKAWVVDPATTAKLKISFFWSFRSDYWIIDLGQDYEFAVVGTPDREHLWILSREKRLNPVVVDAIVHRLKEQRFPVEKLIWQK